MRSRTQEDLQSQLTWAHGASQSLGYQPGGIQELDLDPISICSRCTAWFSSGSSKKRSKGCLCLSSLSLRYLVGPQWERIYLVLKRRGEANEGKGFVVVRLGREEEGGCDRDVSEEK